jgi:hypothetical protein
LEEIAEFGDGAKNAEYASIIVGLRAATKIRLSCQKCLRFAAESGGTFFRGGSHSKAYSTAAEHASLAMASLPCCRRLCSVSNDASHAGQE